MLEPELGFPHHIQIHHPASVRSESPPPVEGPAASGSPKRGRGEPSGPPRPAVSKSKPT